MVLMKQAAKPTWHRTDIRLCQKSQQGTEDLCLTTNEELNPANKLGA